MRAFSNSLKGVKIALAVVILIASVCISVVFFSKSSAGAEAKAMFQEATATLSPGLYLTPDGAGKGEFAGTGGSIQANPLTDVENDQVKPAVVYNSSNDTYTIVYENHQYGVPPGGDSDITATRVNSNGSPYYWVNVTFDLTLGQSNPTAAFNSANNNILVVWEYPYPSDVSDLDINSRLIDADGNLNLTLHPINSSSLVDRNPQVVYNSSENLYLVVWESCTHDDVSPACDVYGQQLTAAGAQTGSVISIATGTTNQRYPRVAYNSWQDEYLVVWQELSSSGDWDIFGQRINWDGSLNGGAIDIESPGLSQTKPDIAYNFYNNEYMVVWEDQWGGATTDWDIKAWRLNGNGNHVTPSSFYMISGDGEGNTKRRMNPRIAYADGAHEYLITFDFEYETTDIDVLFTRIKSNGELRVKDSVISNAWYINEDHAAVASNLGEKYFVGWEDSRNYGSSGIDIYGNIVTAFKFYGNFYQGLPGDYSSPMNSMSVSLYCSGTPDSVGNYLEEAATDPSGYFAVYDHGGCNYYNLIANAPGGFVSTGAQPPTGGTVKSNNWIQFTWPLDGKTLGPNYFWAAAPTPTATSTQTATATGTNTNTPTVTHTSTSTGTNTYTPTATRTNTPTATGTNTYTPTATGTITFTPTPSSTSSNSPTPTNTTEVTPTHTSTSTGTSTFTQTPTVTNTPTPTATATITYPITWIHFEEFSGGTYINDHYAEQGLHFMSDYLYGYGFRAAPFIQSSAFARTAPNILVNNATGGEFFSSINVPMVFWFDQPMAKLGMWLGAVGETCNSVPATIVVYDCKGNVISVNQYTTNQSFIPLEIDDELGRIQRVKIDFGGSSCLEAVDELAFQQSDAEECLDYSNPDVTIEQPVAGSNFSSPGIMIQGTIDETGILRSATLNGSRLPVYMNSLTGIYKFSKPVTLQPGSNTYLAAADNYSNKPGSDIAWYTLGAPSSVTLKEFHLTQRGVVKNLSCDIDNPFVAAKSTLVRIKLDVKTATGASAHVSSVDLKVYQSYDFVTEGLVDTVAGASYPSWGTSFVSSAQMDEILFWVSSDTFQEAAYYRFEIQPWVGAAPFGPPIQLNCGGKWFPFNATRHLKLLIVPVEAGLNSPLLAETSHNADFIKQLAVTSRTLPLADQVYPYYGVTYQEIAPFKMCDGTTNSTTMYPNICLGTGWEWKHIDKDPSGVLNRMYDAYVEDQNTGFCNAKDHTNGGRELGVGLIPYIFNPQLGIFRPGAHPGWNYAADNIAKHQTPIDEDHDNDIDLTDLSLYIGSHYDETQGKWLLYPSGYYNMGETFRFFGDLNNNNCNDAQSDYQTPILKKFHPSILDKPQEEAYLSYNAAIPGTSNDFTSGILVFPYTFVATDSRYGDIGPGQGSSPGHNVWIRLFPNSNAFAHELGHNTAGLADQYYDNVADDLLTKENASAVYVGTVKLPPNQAWIVMGSDAGWNRVVHWKPDYQSLFDKLKIGPILNNTDVQENVEVFILNGLREQDGSLSHLQTQRAMDVEQSPSDPVSPYKLVFGSDTTTLLEYPFTAGVQSPPAQGYLDVTIYPVTFAVIAPWPDGTTWVEVRKNADVLARFDQSGAAPSVQVVAPNGGNDFSGMNETVISWISGDTDSDPNSLVHSIFYSVDGGTTWTLIAANVGGNQFTWPLNNLPGTTQGLVKVVVSDGFLSGEDASNEYFTLANKPPTAVILSPTGDNDVLQCGKIQLDGAAIDPEEAVQSITWSVDGIPVTSSLQDFIPPQSPGLHTITLEVRDNIQQTSSDSKEIEVIDDLDCDGMGDNWETIQSFDSTNPSDAGQDADNDDVTNRNEFFWGLDPHNPDTDGDGISDGTEIAQGTDPSVPEPGPTWIWIYLPVVTR